MNEQSRHVHRITEHGDEVIVSQGLCFGAVTLRLSFDRGGAFGPPALTRAVWDQLERGTALKTRNQLHGELEALGASTQWLVSRSSVSIEVSTLSDAIGSATDLVLESLLRPLEKNRDLKNWREEIDEEQDALRYEAEWGAERLFERLWWGDDRWGIRSVGTRQHRQELSLQALRTHRETLLSARAVVGVACDPSWRGEGDALAQSVLERVRVKAPRGLSLTLSTAPAPPAPGTQRRGVIVYPEAAQAALFFGTPAPRVDSEDWVIGCLHSLAFGGGFTSPLVQRIRADLGLSYEVGWSTESNGLLGQWRGFVAPESHEMNRVLDEVHRLWSDFVRSGPTPEQWRTAQRLMRSHHLSALSTTTSRMRHACALRLLGLDIARQTDVLDRASQSTSDDGYRLGHEFAGAMVDATIATAQSGEPWLPGARRWFFDTDERQPWALATK
ncbi:MAG: zinc protease [Bradymonadia bacterium]|jgi:zinc protease